MSLRDEVNQTTPRPPKTGSPPAAKPREQATTTAGDETTDPLAGSASTVGERATRPGPPAVRLGAG